MPSPPETCPICGADVPARAKACPECGADEQTGWSDEAYVSQINLPDESFDHEDFVQREFAGKTVRPYGVKWVWWIVALVLAVLFAGGWLMFRR